MLHMVTARISNWGSSGWSCEMNCGSTATMKMMPLGLVALVRKPVSTRFCSDGSSASSIALAQAAPGPNILFVALM
eukprot:gene32024-36154_t